MTTQEDSKGIDSPIPMSRTFLDSKRSMGSVIKLLNVSSKYTDEYNSLVKKYSSIY